MAKGWIRVVSYSSSSSSISSSNSSSSSSSSSSSHWTKKMGNCSGKTSTVINQSPILAMRHLNLVVVARIEEGSSI